MNLEQKLDILGKVILRARVFFDFWWIYEGAPNRSKHLSAMNCYPEFFRYDSASHQVAYIMLLCQIFEDKPHTINLPTALEEAKNISLPADCIQVADEALKKGLLIWEKLVIIRSNLFAHRNISLTYPDAFRKANIKPSEIKLLTEYAIEAINALRAAFALRDLKFSSIPEMHLTKLLESIRR